MMHVCCKVIKHILLCHILKLQFPGTRNRGWIANHGEEVWKLSEAKGTVCGGSVASSSSACLTVFPP